MQTIQSPIDQLLEKIKETVPTATIAQVEDILMAQGTTPDAVLTLKDWKFNRFIDLVKNAQPGGLAVADAPIVSAVSTQSKAPQSKVIATQSASLSVPVPAAAPVVDGDRDWASFDPNKLTTLSLEDLELYSDWQEKEDKRIALLNKIQGRRVTTIAATEESLKNQLTIAETSRRVIQAQAQVEVLNEGGGELETLVADLGKQMAINQMDRDRQAFTDLSDLGKSTPTEGELALLQGRMVNRDRMNRAATVTNSTAAEIKAIGPTATEKPMVTIDA